MHHIVIVCVCVCENVCVCVCFITLNPSPAFAYFLRPAVHNYVSCVRLYYSCGYKRVVGNCHAKSFDAFPHIMHLIKKQMKARLCNQIRWCSLRSARQDTTFPLAVEAGFTHHSRDRMGND